MNRWAIFECPSGTANSLLQIGYQLKLAPMRLCCRFCRREPQAMLHGLNLCLAAAAARTRRVT